MKRIIPFLQFAASILALVTAIMGFNVSRKNKLDINSQKQEIQRIRDTAYLLSVNLTIDSPKSGEVITAETYKEMHGRIDALPYGYRMYVLANDTNNYFLMYPPAEVVHALKVWSHKNIRMQSYGSWELSVCVADKKAIEWVENRIKQDDWSGFSVLPDGMAVIRKVSVVRR